MFEALGKGLLGVTYLIFKIKEIKVVLYYNDIHMVLLLTQLNYQAMVIESKICMFNPMDWLRF